MKLSQKDAKLLIILACILLLAASYFFGYKKYTDLTDELETQIQAKQTEYTTLDAYNQHRREYQTKIEDNKTKIGEIVAKYPSKVTDQDELYLSSVIQEKCGGWITTFDFTDVETIYVPGALMPCDTTVTTDNQNSSEVPQATPAPSADTDANKVPAKGDLEFCGNRNITQLGFQVDYDQLKKMVQFIYDYPQRKVINELTLAVDNTTGLLTGRMNYSSYSMEGAGATYEPLTIPSTPMGNKNVFGDIVANKDKSDKTNKNEKKEN